MNRYDPAKLKSFTAAVMQGAGLDEQDSLLFAESLVNADMRGVASHGVTRLTAYSRRVQEGLVSPKAELNILADGGSLMLVDAQNGMGAVTAYKAMKLCVERAKTSGCCFAAITGGNHFGYAAFFTEYAAAQGMIGVAIANAPPAIPPIGGVEPFLGTNPISISVPSNRYRPLVLDMATSVVARGKVTLAQKAGQSIPEGWGIDKKGRPTTDPSQVYAVLPFGGAKGYAIGLIAEILCSCLSGASNGREMGSFYNFNTVQNSGFFVGAFNIGSILPAELFGNRVDGLYDTLKAAPKAEGVEEIMIPGEIEFNRYEQASREGITLPAAVVAELVALSQHYQIPFDCEMA